MPDGAASVRTNDRTGRVAPRLHSRPRYRSQVHSTARHQGSPPFGGDGRHNDLRLILPNDRSRPVTLARAASGRLNPVAIAAAVDAAFRAGYPEVRTQAMFAAESAVFAQAGAQVRSTLVLLERPVTAADRRPSRFRQPHRLINLDAVAELDARAFDEEWRFDRPLLRDALDATQHHRLVGFGPIGRPIAYCLAGRSGRHGYIQRLAVAPERAGRGLGSLLVADALAWFARRGVAVAQVNTEPHNLRALDVYERLAFRTVASPIYVMAFDRS
jgi:ribosomal protein S18 acetylase RimI-like enzyme